MSAGSNTTPCRTYADFIETEVLPRIEKDYKVTFTKDPEGRATMGGSSGGAAAFTMAWFRPDLYHRVLTYSGTYVDQQSPMNPESPHGAWEYHENLIPRATPNLCGSGWKWARRTMATTGTKRPCTTGCSPTTAWPPS